MRSRDVSMRTARSSTRSGFTFLWTNPRTGSPSRRTTRSAPEAFHLPPIAFTDSERAALQTALTLLDGEFAYAEPLRLALQQITWGRPSPLGSDSRQTIGLGITASAGGGEVSARLAKIDTAIYRRKRIEFEYYTIARDETVAAQGRPVPPAVRGRPVLPRRLLARARRRPRVPAVADPRQGGVRDQGRARLPAAGGLRPARLREPDPVAVRRRRRDVAEVEIPEDLAWYVERQFGAYGTLDGQRLPHRVRAAAAADLVGAELRAADPRAAGAASTRRAERVDALIEAPPRRAAGAWSRARPRRRGRWPSPTAAAAARRRRSARALRAAGHARDGADRRRPRRRAAAGRRRLRPAPASRRRNCARTSRCSTSSTSAAART